MLDAISKTTITCTSDKQFRGGKEKTCVNTVTADRIEVVCNYDRYMSPSGSKAQYDDPQLQNGEFTDVDAQYELTHHELAGRDFEPNLTDESDYHLSRQLSAKLQSYVVRMLPIIPTSGFFQGMLTDSKTGTQLTIKCANVSCTEFDFFTIQTKGAIAKLKKINSKPVNKYDLSSLADDLAAKAGQTRTPVLFDFTGDNCGNCGYIFELTTLIWRGQARLAEEAENQGIAVVEAVGGAVLTPVAVVADVVATAAVDAAAVISWPVRSLLSRSSFYQKANKAIVILTDKKGTKVTVSHQVFEYVKKFVAK